MANHDKTEQATPRKKQKAREKGQIARSRDLMSSLALAATVLLLAAQSSGFAVQWHGLLRRTLDAAATGELQSGTPLLMWAGTAMLGTLALVLGLSWLAAAVGALAQGGLVFAPAALQPNLSRLSPATRLEQLFSLPSLGRLLKSLLPGAAIVYAVVAVLGRDWSRVLHLSHRSAAGLTLYSLARIFEVGWKCALVLLLWSGADYLIERHKLASDLRMSRQDLMDEYKETEGHPTVKARIRRLRRQVPKKCGPAEQGQPHGTAKRGLRELNKRQTHGLGNPCV